MSRFVNPVPQYFTNDGKVLASGTVEFFKSGTSSPLTTYADSALSIANPNPLVLDAAGRLPNCFFEGSAKIQIRNSAGTLIREVDPVGGEEATGEWVLWDANITYDIPNIVKGSDGKFYISIINSNINNDPTASPSAWSEIRLLGVWNTNESYSINDVVQDSTGNLWKSLTNGNTGNDPTTDDGTNWDIAISQIWINKNANFTIVENIKYQIDGSSGSVDAALPTSLTVGANIIVHNESISTNTVRLTNTALTIKGPSGTVTTSDNLELSAGDTAHLVAKSATVLEVV